jgi:hypothetical protein
LDWGNWVIEKIETTVQVGLEMGERSPNFKGVHVIVRAKVPIRKTSSKVSQMLRRTVA